FNPATYYNGQMAGLAGNVRTQIATGIQNGLTMIKNIMTGATVQDQQKQDQLRSASQETYGAGGRHLASFDTLEGNLAYLESYTSARQSGLNAGAAETAGKVAASKTLMAQQ